MQNRLSKLVQSKADNNQAAPKVEIEPLNDQAGAPLLVKSRSYGLILANWVQENRNLVEEKLKQYGAILFRGFKIDTVEKFQEFIGTFDSTPLQYKNRSSPRFEVAKNIYHSTTYPEDQSINMHSENSYLPQWPMHIVFCCITPAEVQGETPIADTRLVYQHLGDATREKFSTKGVQYVRHISKHLGLPWQEVFQTSDKAVVEEECKRNGMALTWLEEEQVVLKWKNKAIYDHPVTGEKVWFNHAFFFNKYALDEETVASIGPDDKLPFDTFYGDGSPISRAEIEELRTAYAKATIVFPWLQGDVLFMDNMLMAHGRSPYKGDRKIIVSMF